MAESRRFGKPFSSPDCHLGRDEEIRTALIKICTSDVVAPIAKALGLEANLHLVGGTVRDACAGLPAADIDLASKHPVAKNAELLQESGIRVIETGVRHGTITALVQTQHIEITTFRCHGTDAGAGSYTIEEDLAARDFTINAMAFSLSSHTLIDPFGGRDDLRDGVVRAVGSPEDRMREDPLRMLRMVRLGPALGRRVESQTAGSVNKLAQLLVQVSPERIRGELEKILTARCAGAALRTLHELGLLQYIVPEMLASVGFEQNEFHIHDVFEHTLWVLDRCPFDLNLRLAALFHDLGKPHTLTVGEDGRRHFYLHEQVSEEISKKVMKRLRFSNEQIESVARIVRFHMRPTDCGPAGVRRLMRDLGEQFEEWRQFKKADAPPVFDDREVDTQLGQFDKMVSDERERLKKIGQPRLPVNGEDLKNLGLQPGKVMGQILRTLEELVIENPELNERELLLKRAQDLVLKLQEGSS